MAEPEYEQYKMRAPCSQCGCEFGILRTVGFQDTVKCHQCGLFQYNAPRKETGKPQLHVPMREKISPSLRAEVLTRSGCACELCHRMGIPLTVAHLLSLEAGRAAGLSEDELNSEENLSAMCEACNSGIGKNPVPLRVMIAIIQARFSNKKRRM
jgi:hypothetical protein